MGSSRREQKRENNGGAELHTGGGEEFGSIQVKHSSSFPMKNLTGSPIPLHLSAFQVFTER